MLSRKQFKATLTIATLTAFVVDFVAPNPAAGQTCVAPPSNLVSWWAGDGSASDIQDGNDGTLVNGVTFVTGQVGQAFRLDGIDDFVEIPSDPNLEITGSLTMAAWINGDSFSDPDPSVAGSQRAIVTKWNSQSKRSYGLQVRADPIDCGIGHPTVLVTDDPNTPHVVCGVTELQPGVWYHVAGTFDAATGEGRVYVNGSLDGSGILPFGTIHASPQRVMIGALDNPLSFSPPDSGHFGGLIDEVSLYNRVLTAAEIQAIFNAGSAGMCKPVCGDGVVDPGEACDDGNQVNCDGCRGDCSAVEGSCGDGTLDTVCEACDDGNNVNCDGCRSDCSAVEGTCGDGSFDAVCEACDDGNNVNCDGCRGDCSAVDETCDDLDPCTDDSCDPGTGLCINDPIIPCCGNGSCDAGEDCNSCSADCFSSPAAVCGNNVCETADAEDCVSCPEDCNGKQTGRPSGRFCCGDGSAPNGVTCADVRCTGSGNTCTDAPATASCCGDDVCEGSEDQCNCNTDCGTPPGNEGNCTDGIDNDCDGATDCDDGDCTDDPACACGGNGAPCQSDSNCCSGKCRNGLCRGN